MEERQGLGALADQRSPSHASQQHAAVRPARRKGDAAAAAAARWLIAPAPRVSPRALPTTESISKHSGDRRCTTMRSSSASIAVAIGDVGSTLPRAGVSTPPSMGPLPRLAAAKGCHAMARSRPGPMRAKRTKQHPAGSLYRRSPAQEASQAVEGASNPCFARSGKAEETPPGCSSPRPGRLRRRLGEHRGGLSCLPLPRPGKPASRLDRHACRRRG